MVISSFISNVVIQLQCWQSGVMTNEPNDMLTSALALGQNRRMPSRLELADLPPRAAAAQKAISGTARVSVLRYVLDHPGSSRPGIVAGTGVSLGSASVALRELEELGYVAADVEEPRKGRTVRYSANRGILTDDLTAFMAWMLR